MNKKSWIIFSVITFGILAIMVLFSNGSKIDVSKIDVNAVQSASEQNGNIGDQVFGKVGSKVTLIEYADYQCPGCAGIYPLVKSVVEHYKDQVQFVYRNFPLTDAHPNALAAAGSAEAAGLQGKFWEMHDKIYENQDNWKSLSITERGKYFENFAKSLGLNVVKFNSDLADKSDKYSIGTKINFDTNLGKKAGVNATPTFYLNGTKLDQTKYENDVAFKKTIDAELKKAGIPIPTP